MATRSQAREVIVGMLYAYHCGNTNIGNFAAELLEEKHVRNRQKDFALFLFEGTIARLTQIDTIIKGLLKDWNFERLGDMEKAILRLGVFELMATETDRAVVIDEAIGLAKKFGGDNAPRFVNGVLDAFGRDSALRKAAQAESDFTQPKKGT